MARLRRIGEQARAILLAAAVIGRKSTFAQLVEVAGLDEAAGLEGLERLLNGRLLHEAQETVYPYTIAHDKIREVVYTEASEARRQIFHRRTLAVLAALETPAADLAFHALRSQQFVQAFHYSLAAAQAAIASAAAKNSVRLLDQAHQLAQQIEVGNAAMQEMYTLRGRALELAHRFEDAMTNYEELAELSEQREDPELLLASLIARATLFSTPSPLNDPGKGVDTGERAISLARQIGDHATEAKALWTMLLVHHYALGDEESARSYGESAVKIARRLNLIETLAYVLNDLNWVYMTLGNFRQAKACLSEAMDLWRELHNVPMLVDSLNGAGILYSLVGEFESALTAVEEGIALAKSINNVWNQIAIRANLIWVYRERGEYGEIIAALEDAIALAQSNMPIVAAYFQASLALVYTDLGAIELAMKTCACRVGTI